MQPRPIPSSILSSARNAPRNTATRIRPSSGFLTPSCRLQRPQTSLVGKAPPRVHTHTPVRLQSTNSIARAVSSRSSPITTTTASTADVSIEMGKVDTTARLSALRALMSDNSIDVYIVPSEDSHSSEYIAPCDARRAFISGFTGSAGCAVITQDKAALATDGRYFNQASQQLDENWLLLKQGTQGVQTWQEWAAEQSAGGKSVGVDPTLLTGVAASGLETKIKKAGGQRLTPLDANLVDKIWGAGRPARPNKPVILLGDERAGKSLKDKLTELRKELESKNSLGFVVSMLDEVAWLFNLRGNDIPYNPVFFSYAVVTQEEATLYIDSSKLSQDCQAYLVSNQVTIKDYDELLSRDATALGEVAKMASAESSPSTVLISTKTSWALKEALGGSKHTEDIRSPVGDAKAIKNETELNGMRDCHVRDGAALIEFFAWLEHQLVHEKAQVDEVQAADKLEALRGKQKDYAGLSFPTISSTGPNAAVIHYKPEAGSCSIIDPEAVYLCDSGAQYRDGTTDVTRTLHFGTPTAAEIEAYTLVLKGNISLDTAIFPKGTTGYALDSLARQHLWKQGLDYRHGTGHGIGSFLNVHEGPIGIGTRTAYAEVSLSAGHVLSNEPGFYEDGSFGIRIENVMMTREVKPKHSFGDKPFLGFEHVTMAPYCRKLIDVSLLTDAEKQWINESHADIWAKTKGYFEGDKVTLDWLERETQPL